MIRVLARSGLCDGHRGRRLGPPNGVEDAPTGRSTSHHRWRVKTGTRTKGTRGSGKFRETAASVWTDDDRLATERFGANGLTSARTDRNRPGKRERPPPNGEYPAAAVTHTVPNSDSANRGSDGGVFARYRGREALLLETQYLPSVMIEVILFRRVSASKQGPNIVRTNGDAGSSDNSPLRTWIRRNWFSATNTREKKRRNTCRRIRTLLSPRSLQRSTLA